MTNFWAVLKIFIRLLRVSAENLLRLSLTDPFSGRVPHLTPQISRPYSFEASEGHEILARAEISLLLIQVEARLENHGPYGRRWIISTRKAPIVPLEVSAIGESIA
jgi:hypothetical protein